MSGYKDLSLRRELIEDAVKGFRGSSELTIKTYPKFKKLIVTVPNEKDCTISYYENVKGTVSFSIHESKDNEDLATEIVEHVIKETLFDEKNSMSIYVSNFSETNLTDLVEYLETYYEVQKIQTQNRANGYTVVLKSSYGDKCHLNYFNNQAFNVQGRSGLMKSLVIEGLAKYLPFGDLVQATLSGYNAQDVSKTEVEELFEARIPTANGYLDDIVKAILMPAIVTERLEVNTTDYSFITFPVFRGLEAFMKQIFNDAGIPINENFGERFDKNPTTGLPELNVLTKNSVNCIYKQTAVLKCYIHFKQTRHLIFHTTGILIGTSVIEDIKDAKSHVSDVFNLIENSVRCIKESNTALL